MVSKIMWNASPAFSCREDLREGRTSVGGSFCLEHLLGVVMWRQRLSPSGCFILANPWLPDKRAFNRKKLGWQQVACTDKKVKEWYCEHQCSSKECDVGILVGKGQMSEREVLSLWFGIQCWQWMWTYCNGAGQLFLELETNDKAKQQLLSLGLCF